MPDFPTRTAVLSGIFVPTLAPVRPDGSLNEEEASRLFDWLLSRGVAGLYPNGSTGEFARLTDAQQDTLLGLAVAAAAPRDAAVLAGAAGGTVRLALDRCRAAADRGATAAAVVAPYYYALQPDTVEGFYRELAAQSPIDLLLYNIPLFASAIPPEVVRRLALDCPRIVGIKDSSGDADAMRQMIDAVRPQRPAFTFLTGWDTELLTLLRLGCDGGTHASANVIPDRMVALHDAFRRGDDDAAAAIQRPVADLFNAMIGTGGDGPEFPDGFRVGCAARGFGVRDGLLPRSAQQTAALDALAARLPGLLAAFDTPEPTR